MNEVVAAKAPLTNKGAQSQKVKKPELRQSMDSPVEKILFLQRTIGNQAVERLIRSGALQAKLRIGQPGDEYEQEADRMAERVMRMPEPQKVLSNNFHIQRASPKCEEKELKRQPIKEEEDEKLQKKTASGCADLSQVRVHADSKVADAARGVNVRAFTMGHDVVYQADLANVDIPPHRAPSVLQKSLQPFIMRAFLFSGPFQFCRTLLKTHVFHVSQGGIRVSANAAYERRGTPECSSADYHMTLNKKNLFLEIEYGTCEFPQGQIFSRQWKNLPAGDYTLTIWTNNTNPYCCLVGDIIIDQQSGLQGDSCTQSPPGPLQILHLALDLAGLIPGVGVVADGANLIIYAAEGDWTNAGISLFAILPVIGGAAVVMRRGRQVVRVSGEVVEQMGRNRITSALRQARRSRRAAGDAGEIGESARRRMFAQRNPHIADPTLPPGTGHTDRFGNMTISSAGSATDQALARYHERVHSFLSPRLNFLRNFRANVGMSAYQRSALLQYLEEALAETYAQLRVYGIHNLPNGIRFPIREGYVTLRAVVTEAAIGTILFGGLTYGVYMWASQQPSPETP